MWKLVESAPEETAAASFARCGPAPHNNKSFHNQELTYQRFDGLRALLL